MSSGRPTHREGAARATGGTLVPAPANLTAAPLSIEHDSSVICAGIQGDMNAVVPPVAGGSDHQGVGANREENACVGRPDQRSTDRTEIE